MSTLKKTTCSVSMKQLRKSFTTTVFAGFSDIAHLAIVSVNSWNPNVAEGCQSNEIFGE